MSILEESWEQTRDRLRAGLGREGAVMYSDKSSRLGEAIRALYPASGEYAWMRDFDDEWVIFELEQGADIKRMRIAYSWDADGNPEFNGSAEEVKEVTTFVPVERAFVTETNGKTLLTGRVSAAASPLAAKAFLHLDGRFVGADIPNRNKALWTTEDLEFGQPTVASGPLNWLHEERHVIGAITRSQLVIPERENADDVTTPYIHASSSVWRWLYPTEAALIEQASENSSLWYSMECVSELIECTGCGGSFDYADVQRAKAGQATTSTICEHVIKREVARRYVRPTFLGGAVILPPTRPGWADANLTVDVTKAAEEAFKPEFASGMSDREWASLMAQVMSFAQN